jgi:hypothetical protein
MFNTYKPSDQPLISYSLLRNGARCQQWEERIYVVDSFSHLLKSLCIIAHSAGMSVHIISFIVGLWSELVLMWWSVSAIVETASYRHTQGCQHKRKWYGFVKWVLQSSSWWWKEVRWKVVICIGKGWIRHTPDQTNGRMRNLSVECRGGKN